METRLLGRTGRDVNVGARCRLIDQPADAATGLAPLHDERIREHASW